MYKKFFLCTLAVLSLTLNTVSCSSFAKSSNIDNTRSILHAEISPSQSVAYLPQSVDLGQEYIDSFIFLGESTTYHLKNRGVLSGGTETLQVWGPKSGTLMLDRSVSSCRIVYPETGEELDISEAMQKKKPKYLLLTFGLNGATSSISKGSEYFKSCYSRLISTLLEASPSTNIIIQSCFPVAENMDMRGYSVTACTLNQYIDIINSWSAQLAADLSIGYLNTAEILKDDMGFLKTEYQAGDGYHLTKSAYVEILKYIRTHGYKEKSNE